MINKNGKWIRTWLLLLSMTAVLCGCTSEKDEANISNIAKGRYVGDEIQMPGGKNANAQIYAFAECEDGILRCLGADGNVLRLYESDDGGYTWSVSDTVSGIMDDADYIFTADIDAQGNTLFVGSARDVQKLYYTESGGELQAIAIELPVLEDFYEDLNTEEEVWENPNELYYAELVGEDRVLGFNQMSGLYLIDLQTGELIEKFGYDTNNMGMEGYTISGDVLIYKMQDEAIRMYDLKKGEALESERVLIDYFDQRDIERIQGNLKFFMKPTADADGFYFCDRSGLYRYVFGSSQIEMIMDGNNTLLSNPEYLFEELLIKRDASFLFSYSKFKSEAEWSTGLVNYYYSEEAATVPDKELTIYSLYDNFVLKQAVADFQKAHSDYYINLEVGVPYEDDTITVDEAMDELNTRILAGTGPDIIIANAEFPLEAYMEKGFFSDISGVLREAEESGSYYSQMLWVFADDLECTAVPTRFGVPVINGPEDLLDDADSVADLFELTWMGGESTLQFTGELEYMEAVPEKYFLPAYRFIIEKDGSLNEQALEDYIDMTERIYNMKGVIPDKEFVAYDSFWWDFSPSINGNVTYNLSGMNAYDFGYLKSYEDYETMMAVIAAAGWEYKLSGNGMFLPMDVAAVNARSEKQEESAEFIKFLLSEEYQQKRFQITEGFPVSRNGLSNLYRNSAKESKQSMRTTITSGNADGVDITVEYRGVDISEEQFKELDEQFSELSVPLTYNYKVTGIVMEEIYDYLTGGTDKTGSGSRDKSGFANNI